MQPATTLQELVQQLGRTHSPFERLKILGHGWKLLRQMTPEQRMIVAAQLGLDHADEVVDSIARRSGTQASPALISLIEKAQVKGTPHLPELIADLRDPKRRAERLRQGTQAALNTAEAALAEEAPAVPWLPPGAVSPPAEPRRPAPAAARPAPTAPPPVVAAAAPPEKKPAPPPTPVAPAVAAAPVAPPAPVTAAPATAAPPPRPAPPAVAPETRPAEARPAPRPAPAAPPAPRAAPAPDDALAGRLAAVPSLMTRFRLLRRQVNEAKGMSAAGLRSIVECFPDGWARRRALLELLRGGVPGSLRDALTLVEALGSDRDRLWCLGALTDSREIQESEREALLAAASSPTARRRLERRLGER